MKKLIAILMLGSLMLNSKAQEANKSKSDTTKYSFYKRSIWVIPNLDTLRNTKCDTIKPKDSKFNSWSGIGMGVNGYLNSQGGIDIPKKYDFLELDYNKSLSFNWNFADVQLPIYKNYISLVSGLGLEFNHYSFKNPIRLNVSNDTVTAVTDSTISYRKNKLNATYIEIPLLLEFNTSNKQSESFHIAVGAYFGYKIGSKIKQRYDYGGKDFKLKKKDDYNLAPFRFGVMSRVGYGDFTFFANYAASELFETNTTTPLIPFSVGMMWNL